MSTGKSGHKARQPLDGVRIIAVEQYGAGPWGTMFLADLGAEIIKLENPGTGGDVARYVPPYTADRDSVYFQSFNRNKKSITLNLRHPQSKAILHRLVKVSDAVFNNLRGDLPSKLGLDYPSLGPLKPSIVCCSLSAFGRRGARAGEPGYDYTMQAYAGWMSITGEPDSPPQKSGLSMVDYSGGVMAALGMVSAILGARESGRGCDVDVSLFDNAIAHLSYLGAWHLTKGYEPRRWPDSSHPSQVPSQVLPTRDGWLVVMCAKEKFYQNLVSIMGSPELAEDPRFDTFAGRLENREVLGPILKDLSRKRTTAEWLEMLKGEVPCAPVNSVEEALRDPQVAEDGMVLEMDHPELGTIRQLASPIKISDVKATHRLGPALGEHTDRVLREYADASDDEISSWRRDGVL
jgi:crotonobetainyl-CoA:carnitine CoA-transferase CaiB-like acyl-CoA transferase